MEDTARHLENLLDLFFEMSAIVRDMGTLDVKKEKDMVKGITILQDRLSDYAAQMASFKYGEALPIQLDDGTLEACQVVGVNFCGAMTDGKLTGIQPLYVLYSANGRMMMLPEEVVMSNLKTTP